jgi:hypothetical protein
VGEIKVPGGDLARLGLVATTFINSLGLSLGDEFYNSGIFLKGLSLDLPRVFHCHFSNVCQGISL